MKKLFLITVAALTFISCSNEMALNGDDTFSGTTQMQKAPMQDEMIPVAKLTDKGEIELLFLQKDVQEFFAKRNPGKRLVFVEVIDKNKDGSNAGLLFRIINEKERSAETSLFNVLTLTGGVYYTSLKMANFTRGTDITCSTKSPECSYDPNGCVPEGTACKRCPNYDDDCAKSTSSSGGLTHSLQSLQCIIEYLALVK